MQNRSFEAGGLDWLEEPGADGPGGFLDPDVLALDAEIVVGDPEGLPLLGRRGEFLGEGDEDRVCDPSVFKGHDDGSRNQERRPAGTGPGTGLVHRGARVRKASVRKAEGSETSPSSPQRLDVVRFSIMSVPSIYR